MLTGKNNDSKIYSAELRQTHRRLLHGCGRALPSDDLATCHDKRNYRFSCYRPAVVFSLIR